MNFLVVLVSISSGVNALCKLFKRRSNNKKYTNLFSKVCILIWHTCQHIDVIFLLFYFHFCRPIMCLSDTVYQVGVLLLTKLLISAGCEDVISPTRWLCIKQFLIIACD